MSGRINVFAVFGLVAVCALTDPATTRAQRPDGGRIHVTRDSLVQLLGRLDATSNSKGYSEALRERARREANLLRNRLQQGDFQIGDRVYLSVERQAELTDTFTVSPGPTLNLPTIREVSLAGLLRAELEPHLRQHLRRFLVDPQVQATSLMRIWVEGGVNNPGVYLVPAQSLITDALMRAGGTTRDAQVTAIRIEREKERIWEGEVLQRAITEGKTLDQLSLRAGDRIIVGAGGGSNTFGRVRNILIAVVPLIAVVTQIF